MTAPRTASRPGRTSARAAGSKREATRGRLLEVALALFQERGVDGATMRDIAAAAGLSLGAAYYHFPSKQALIFAFYEDNQRDHEARAAALAGATRDPRARLGALLHGKLDAIRPHRALLASMVHHLVDPGDPLSAFSARTRSVRERSIACFAAALDGGGLPAGAVQVVAHALWLVHLGSMLVYVHDRSRGQRRTHRLVDDGLDLLVPLLPLLGSPLGVATLERIRDSLARAGLELSAT